MMACQAGDKLLFFVWDDVGAAVLIRLRSACDRTSGVVSYLLTLYAYIAQSWRRLCRFICKTNQN